jgi:hypothetical protein
MRLLRLLDVAEIQNQADQAEQKSIQKTPEAAKEGGVISAQPNQEIHGQAFAVTHANDLRPSDPSLIATKDGETLEEYRARVKAIKENPFVLVDSQTEKTKVFEHPAGQAVEQMPSLPGSALTKPPFNSSVKLNMQITNVPEVSQPVKPEELLQHADKTFAAGAQAVKPVKTYMAQPNAVTDSLLQIGPSLDNTVNYFANTPAYQVAGDVQAIVGSTGAAIGGALDHAMTSDERANAAGSIMPMFFFEGGKEPINPETIEQMGLEGMSEAELKALGIEKRAKKAIEIGEQREALEIAQQKLIAESVDEKLTNYLLDPNHPRQKAKWFESVMGFTLENKEQLARQIKLEPKYLRPSQTNDWGIMYEQPTTIVGANGRVLENCKIYWLQDPKTGLFEFKNLLLPKKK